MAFSNSEAFLSACRNNGDKVKAAIEACADQKTIDAIEGALGFADANAQKMEQAKRLLEEAGRTELAAAVDGAMRAAVEEKPLTK